MITGTIAAIEERIIDQMEIRPEVRELTKQILKLNMIYNESEEQEKAEFLKEALNIIAPITKDQELIDRYKKIITLGV